MLSCSKQNESNPSVNDKNTEEPITESLPDNFVKVESAGSYTFIATSSNVKGGETVAIPKEYYICKYAVTNADFKKYVDATGASAPKYWDGKNIPSGRDNHPVLWVSCADAENYCKWLSSNSSDWKFRFPSQGEWEWAACLESFGLEGVTVCFA